LEEVIVAGHRGAASIAIVGEQIRAVIRPGDDVAQPALSLKDDLLSRSMSRPTYNR
jgi:hypothetical protein